MSEIVSTPASTKFDMTELIMSIADSPEYRRNHTDGYPVSRALARAALERTGMHHGTHFEDRYTPQLYDASLETAREALIGVLPDYVYAIEAIRYSHTEHHLSDDIYRSMKQRATRFNHVVKAVIERDPTLEFADVSDMVTTLYGVMNRDRWGEDRKGYEREASWFRGQFEGILRGMQQEVVAHQVIEAINRLGPRDVSRPPRVIVNADVSVEDDLRGADIYVTLDGVTFPIDIKASERTVELIHRKHDHSAHVMTSGVRRYELAGMFRISDERALAEAPRMLEKLYAAREEYLVEQEQVLAA